MSSASANTSAPAAVNPMEQAIAATVQHLFASGQISLDMPDEAVVEVVRNSFPEVPALGKTLTALREELTQAINSRGVDEGKVRAIADALFQDCYAKNVAKEAAKPDGLKPKPAILPVDPDFVWGGQCDAIKYMIESGRHPMLSGPSGSCKTFPAEQVLRHMGRAYDKVSVVNGMNQSHFIAQPKVVESNGVSVTQWEDGFVTKAVRNDNVLILDEIDQTQMENVACLRAVSETGVLYVPQTGERLVAGPNFLLVFTCNSLRATAGTYSGYTIDNAISNRCAFIKCDYLPAADEIAILTKGGLSVKDAQTLVNTFKGLRALYLANKIGFAPSTRVIVEVSRMIQGKDAHGVAVPGLKKLSFAEAMNFKIINALPDKEANEALACIRAGI